MGPNGQMSIVDDAEAVAAGELSLDTKDKVAILASRTVPLLARVIFAHLNGVAPVIEQGELDRAVGALRLFTR